MCHSLEVERVVLLEEELRWIKSQYFGTSSQKTDTAAVNPDQSMLFNEVGFLERFDAAARAGFSGVEYLFPYEFDKHELLERLRKHRLTQVLHNLPAGNWDMTAWRPPPTSTRCPASCRGRQAA